MSINEAHLSDLDTVKRITYDTINAIYPHYYPSGAVSFFLYHHNEAGIRKDIEDSLVFLYLDRDGVAVGTVTVKENEILRLFVLPEYQGMGYGKELMCFAENRIAEKYDSIRLDASLPAKSIYLKYGYKETEYHIKDTGNGDHLCYDVMIKRIR